MSTDTQIIGIDCATDPKKVGLAVGRFDGGTVTITEAVTEQTHDLITARLAGWVAQAPRTLIALDAPLGWPVELSKALAGHQAGDLDVPANNLFRRATDRFVADKVGKTPLDVGADRIARTAHAALAMLNRLRHATQLPIPLAWDSDFDEPVAAIEVYPAATLKVWGVPSSGYKRPNQRPERNAILQGLEAHMDTRAVQDAVLDNADMLDAAVCVLAGRDFLEGWAFQPRDQVTGRTEGWIWVLDIERRQGSKGSGR